MKILSAFALALLLAGTLGCASTPEDPLEGVDVDGSQTEDGLSGQGLSGRGGMAEPTATIPSRTPADAEAANRSALSNIIYFEFDSAQIDTASMSVIEAHAQQLRASPDSRVRLEGHTDERGTREYNIALGERRAESVRRALLLRGVARAQLSVVSYGEESPASFGAGESAWGQNRRVEFNYLR
ncbi:MAG: peptidoglycan-associated lipoprotein Pal [Oceanococcaceae bacterium]